MIKAVIFDLGKVIVPFDLERGYRALQPHCGYPIEEIPKRIGGTDLVRRFESGETTPEDFVERLSSLLGIRVGYEQFCQMWSAIFLPDTIVPEELLERLHRRYRVMLLSNTNAIHFDMIRERYAALRHFDDFVLSYQVRAMKPAPRIYAEAIARAGCLPGECFYTDDVQTYVDGARRAGLDAVLFRSVDELEADMRTRGIDW